MRQKSTLLINIKFQWCTIDFNYFRKIDFVEKLFPFFSGAAIFKLVLLT